MELFFREYTEKQHAQDRICIRTSGLSVMTLIKYKLFIFSPHPRFTNKHYLACFIIN